MAVIGLTGGIASGKSTVSAMMRELGAALVDADAIAREVVAPHSEAAREIRERFGDGVFDESGALDRKKLGAIVFSDETARADLNRITHPRIQAASLAQIAELSGEGHDPIIYEAALLVENGIHRDLAGLIVVSVPESLQLERLRKRDGLSEAQALERIRSQLPLGDKVAAATWVIDNSGSITETRKQVESLWQSLRHRK